MKCMAEVFLNRTKSSGVASFVTGENFCAILG